MATDTGALRFGIAANEAEQYLSIDAERGKAYLAAHTSSDSCRLVIGLADWGYSARVVIDREPRITFPDKLSSFHEALVVLRLGNGRWLLPAAQSAK